MFFLRKPQNIFFIQKLTEDTKKNLLTIKGQPMKRAKIEKERLLCKILEKENFQYDKFFNTLPKDIWNFIFSFLQEEDINKLLFVSKSFYQFLNLNSHACWKNIEFRNYITNEKSEQNILSIISFPRFSQITQLKFNTCFFTKDILANILNTQKHVFELSFIWCSLGSRRVLHLIMEWIKLNLTLKTLKFWYNYIALKGLQYICNGLQITPSIKELTIIEAKMNMEEIIIFAEFLKTNSSLEFLRFSYIDDIEGIKILCESLKINITLKKLRIEVRDIAIEGIEYIAALLKINKSLQSLNLSKYQIGIDGAKHIAEALKVNKNLKFLNLKSCKIGSIGAKYIDEALKINTTLELLNFRFNRLGHEDKKMFQGPEFKAKILL